MILDKLVGTILSVNRHSKDRVDSQVAMPIEVLSEADLDRLDQSTIPEETKKLDHLVPEKWQTALDPTKPASANVRRNPLVRRAFFGPS